MRKIIRLTESDLTRIVRRVIKENEEGMIRIPRKYNGVRMELGKSANPQDIIEMYNELVEEGTALVDYSEEGMFYNEDDQEIPTDVILDELNYAIVGEEEDYDDELIREEDDDDDDDGGYYTFDFGGPKDLTALISGISDLIDNSEDVNDFEMKLEEFTNDNRKDFNNLTDNEKNRLDRFINSVMTRHDFGRTYRG
jgi:hypothetical protein